MTDRVRVAVIGTGSMGRNHVRVYRELPQAKLVAVADADGNTAEAIAAQYGTKGYTDYTEMLEREKPDAVTVAVPTSAHYAVAMDALAEGCHVLVEKPITGRLEEASRLIEAAREAGRLLFVGHVERFNPAVVELRRRLSRGEGGRVFQVHARRLGPLPARIHDVGVIVDLAVHDIDVMHLLIGSKPVRLYAEIRQEIHPSHEDLFVGMISFENGVLGLLEINWLTPTKVRRLYVTTERGLYVVDYLTQDLTLYQHSVAMESGWPSLAILRGVNEGTTLRYAVKKKEPLRAEQEAFLAAVRGGDSQRVSGHDGLVALKLAHNLLVSGQQLRVLKNEECV